MDIKMLNNETLKTSLFLVAMSTASVASATSTCDVGYFDPAGGSNCQAAEPGYYVPLAGATEQLASPTGSYVSDFGASSETIAEPGYYVADMAATSPTPAHRGSFVSTVGATNANTATVGYYVPTVAATAQTAVSEGFYTPTNGAINQIPSGGVAVPMTAAMQSERFLTNLAIDLMSGEPSKDRFKAAFAYQQGNLKQQGIATGKLKSDIYGLTFQADLLNHPLKKLGLLLGYSHHALKNTSEIDAKGNTYQIGIFHTLSVEKWSLLGMAMYGATETDNTRLITASYYNSDVINNIETLTSKPKVSWYGLQTKAIYPWEYKGHAFKNFAEFGVVSFHEGRVNEGGSATSDGSSVAPIAKVSIDSFQYTSIPVTVGICYDILNASTEHTEAPLSLSLGIFKDMMGRKDLKVASQYAPSQSFLLPLAQTSQILGLIKLTAVSMDIVKNITLSGVMEAQAGSKFTAYEAYVKASLDW